MQLSKPAIREEAIAGVADVLRSGWLGINADTLPHTTFTPGVHLVETPIERMAQTLHHYLARPEERQPIVERAYRLVTTEYTMRRSVGQILERALAARKQTVSPSP